MKKKNKLKVLIAAIISLVVLFMIFAIPLLSMIQQSALGASSSTPIYTLPDWTGTAQNVLGVLTVLCLAILLYIVYYGNKNRTGY